MTICKVHNIKFYKPKPSGINCMVYESTAKKLAISRSNASIELWNLTHTPYMERTIVHGPDASVEAMCWFDKRLFSVGLTGVISEYDLSKLTAKYALPITGAAGWCMDVHKKSSKLIVGTEQGYLNLYTINSEGLDYEKLLDKQEGRILCLKFDATGNFLASGSINTVRIWNVNSGHAIHKMNLSRLSQNVETVVWCLSITDDFTVISGDSRGVLTFWDGELGAQIESYKTHCAGILTVCLADDQNSLYCAGVDPIIMSYVKINMKNDKLKWVKSIQRKIHDHDVRSLLLVRNKLYSGGVDGYLACSYYPPKTLVKYPPLLQNPCVSVAKDAKLILLRYENEIEVWKLGKEVDDGEDIGQMQLAEEPTKILLLQTKGEEATVCSAISNDGKWVAYSTKNKTRIFLIDYNAEIPQLINYNIPEECNRSIQIAFTPDNRQLILASLDGFLQILDIEDNRLFLTQNINTDKHITDTITKLLVSPCGKYLIAASPNGCVASWEYDDTWKFNALLPRYKSGPTAMNVQPNTNNLIVVYADHKIIEYDLSKKAFTDFSRGLDHKTPNQWLNRSFPVNNITFDPRAEHILLFHDDSTICVINKNKKLSKSDVKIPRIDSSSSSQDGGKLSKHAFHIVKKSKHLVHFDWLGDGEMISVEVSPLSLAESLPPILEKKKFGTK